MTMINNKSEIINKLFFDELKELVDKYNNIDDETITVIERIDNEIEDKYIKEYILKDSNKLDKIITEYKNTNNFISYITSAYHFFDWTRKSKILPDTFKNFLNGHSV